MNDTKCAIKSARCGSKMSGWKGRVSSRFNAQCKASLSRGWDEFTPSRECENYFSSAGVLFHRVTLASRNVT